MKEKLAQSPGSSQMFKRAANVPEQCAMLACAGLWLQSSPNNVLCYTVTSSNSRKWAWPVCPERDGAIGEDSVHYIANISLTSSVHATCTRAVDLETSHLTFIIACFPSYLFIFFGKFLSLNGLTSPPRHSVGPKSFQSLSDWNVTRL